MLLNKVSVHIQALANNIYMRNNTQEGCIYSYLNNSNSRERCQLCSKLTINTPERRYTVFIVHFEHISHLVLGLLGPTQKTLKR